MSSLIFTLAFLCLLCVEAKVDTSAISVSGFSSGAFFAVQYQLAHSSYLKGAAIFAGGPFYCAQGQLTNALTQCLEALAPINLGTLESDARQYASDGSIDGLGNLTKHNVYIYSGQFDETVQPSVVKNLEQMYRDFGVTKITTQYTTMSAHTFPTTDFGNLCLESFTPYISNCGYDGAGNALQTIYGNLKPAVTPDSQNIIQLPQSQFTGGVFPSSLSLDNTAYVYVPSGCKDKTNKCALHIALHGCLQYYGAVGSAFVENAGYNGWAEANNIIVAYPQTTTSFFSPQNPEGCWDWWGYLDSNYATSLGKQMQFLKNLQDFIVASF